LNSPSDLFAGQVTVGESVRRYKPGIPTNQLLAKEGQDVVSLPGVEVTGVMVHTPRHVADTSVARESARAMATLVAALRDAWGDGSRRRSTSAAVSHLHSIRLLARCLEAATFQPRLH
jgi:hypothetical protein